MRKLIGQPDQLPEDEIQNSEQAQEPQIEAFERGSSLQYNGDLPEGPLFWSIWEGHKICKGRQNSEVYVVP